MVARQHAHDDSLSCSGPGGGGGGGRRDNRIIQEDENGRQQQQDEDPSTVATTDNAVTINDDDDAWPTAEGYTPLGDASMLNHMGSILVAMPPEFNNVDNDDDESGFAYYSAGPNANAFVANSSALFGNLDHDAAFGNDNNREPALTANEDTNFGRVTPGFRDIASSALLALENDYEMTLRGEVRPSLMDAQPPSSHAFGDATTSSSGPALSLFQEDDTNSNFADFSSANATASVTIPTTTIHPSSDANQNGSKETITSTISTTNKKELPPIDTVAVKKAVQGIITNTSDSLGEKFRQWQQEKSQNRKQQQQQQHAIIPATPLKAFGKTTPKAVQATANFSRAATLAEAMVRMPPQTNSIEPLERLCVHVVGADAVECHSPERLQQLFAPLARWMNNAIAEKTSLIVGPQHLSISLVGPNVPSSSFMNDSTNLLLAAAGQEQHKQNLETAHAKCFRASYHDWLADLRQQQQHPQVAPTKTLATDESKYKQDDNMNAPLPDIAICYNAGIWGYDEWKPTIRYLINLETPIYFVVTSYTMEEAEDDFDVIQQIVEEEEQKKEGAVGVAANNNDHNTIKKKIPPKCLWEPELNPFGSKQKRETATALEGREYRENAAWQAWHL